MKGISKLTIGAALLLVSACGNRETKHTNTADAQLADNPFLHPSELPFQAPDFNKIKDADFKPAFIEGMRQDLEEVQHIIENKDLPNFENTLIPLEKSGQLLNRVQMVFNLLTSANTNPELQKIQEDLAPKLAANHDEIFLNSTLFKRVKYIHDELGQLKLNPESVRLVNYYFQKFQLAGANLSDTMKNQLKSLNKQEATLSAKFTNQLLAATKQGAVLVSDKSELAGMSDEAIAAAAQNAKENKHSGEWMISLQNTTQQPALQSLSNRDMREKLFEASWNRAEKNDSNDTRSTIVKIAQIRAKIATIMGYENYAAWKLQDQMAKTPATVDAFLSKLVPAAVAKAKSESADIQALIDKQKGGFQLAPWDWDFYADKVRKARYDLDETQIKPYFELNKVLENGVFYAATRLYGIHFKERHDLPVYQKDVRVFEVLDKDSSTIGLFYCDYFKRDNKSGGAWMDNLMGQSKLLNTKPVVYNVCNFTKPAPGNPALISFDDVTTMFHEFGHALHGLFANQMYPSLSGTNVARDFVEFPSQFNEHWAMDPLIFKNYAVHYKTGAPMPQNLIDKIKKSATFNQGYALTELLAAASLDLKWHSIKSGELVQNVDSFETASLKNAGLFLAQVPTRYRSSYFLHIWSNGYAAGYYAYLWTEMLDDDAFAWFQQHGGLNLENGQRFRDMILSKGNSVDLAELFRDFRGSDPDISPMIKDRGLVN